MNHGTVYGYVNLGCRCDDCRQANSDYRRKRRNNEMPPAPVVLRPFEPRPFWFQFASCRPEYADRPLDEWVAMFFPNDGRSNREAREICAECPARDACADHGLAEQHGVWGGTSEKERRQLRRKLATHTSPAA